MSWLITGSEKTIVDPRFGSVSLLLHGNADGSGNIIDSSPSPKTVSKFGNAASATPPSYPNSNSAFGNAIALDGTGDYLSIPDNAAFNFGTEDFTIECWLYIAGNSTQSANSMRYGNIFAKFSTGAPASGYTFYVNGSSTTTGTGFSLDNVGGASLVATVTIDQLVWHHVACARSGTTTRFFLNGVLAGSGTLGNQNMSGSTNDVKIGRQGFSGYIQDLNGYIDDLRVTKGIARYTADFTRPSAPFPDI